MTVKIFVLSVFVSSIFWGSAYAQTVDDALTLSKEDPAGSARLKGLGNVHTSLGGDISSINGNPAGLGFFGRSDINITFNTLHNSNKTYFGNKNSDSKKSNLGIDQAGVVFNFPSTNAGGRGWQNFNIGISYNKTENFNNHHIYDGTNTSNSIVNTLSDIMPGDFSQSNIVDVFADPKNGYFPLAVENGSKNQYNNVLTKGNRSKTAIAFGSNYNNTFYIGATIGISSLQYQKSTQFIENGQTKTAADIKLDNPNSDYANPLSSKYQYAGKSYELFDTYNQWTEGSGFDIKLGMIYKPQSDLNIGLTINTPTWTTINDETEAYTDIDYYTDANAPKPFSYYESLLSKSFEDYQLASPWKFALGATKFFNQGLLTADVEYVTYSTMKYSQAINSQYVDYSSVNGKIKDTYQNALNIRVGGEYLFTNMISGRAGFNYFGNPYKNYEDKNYSGSLGLGFKLTNSAYLDLAVVHQINSYSMSPYTFDEVFWEQSSPIADIDLKRTSGVVTLGVKF